jgi:hypothetical protein
MQDCRAAPAEPKPHFYDNALPGDECRRFPQKAAEHVAFTRAGEGRERLLRRTLRGVLPFPVTPAILSPVLFLGARAMS